MCPQEFQNYKLQISILFVCDGVHIIDIYLPSHLYMSVLTSDRDTRALILLLFHKFWLQYHETSTKFDYNYGTF